MLGTKESLLIREFIIDRCLSDHSREYSFIDILTACNKALPKEDHISLSTLRDDLRAIQNAHKVVIEDYKLPGNNRTVYYSYRDPDYSIYKKDISLDHLKKLNDLINIFKSCQGLPVYSWIQELDAMVKMKLMDVTYSIQPAIEFDSNKSYVHPIIYLNPILEAIYDHQALLINYHSFKNPEPKDHIVHPYYLKQKNQRWYLLGLSESRGCISTFALDRIKYVQPLDKEYIPNLTIDFRTYFDKVCGIFYDPSETPEHIVIKVSKEQLSYIESNPLHSSQHVIEETKDEEYALIEYDICVTYELEMLFLQYGEKVEVLEPLSLREKIRERVKQMFENYNLHLG